MFDFIHVLDDRNVLVALGDIAEPDIMGIFIRPFTVNAWAVFFVMMIFLLLLVMGLHHMQNWNLQNTQILHKLSRIIIVLTWFCYMLIEIYYEGALTMFFSTKTKNPYENIRDVMRANWIHTMVLLCGLTCTCTCAFAASCRSWSRAATCSTCGRTRACSAACRASSATACAGPRCGSCPCR